MSTVNRIRWRSAVVVSLVVAAACRTSATADTTRTTRALAELRVADSSVSAAIAARDAARTATFYAEDAVIMPVAEPIVEGRAAILEEWRHVFGIPGYASNTRLVASTVSVAGDLGYTRGTYESPMLGPGGERLVEKGKWVSVWRRESDERWHIVVDIFNTDSPPPVHAPSTTKRSER